MPKQHFVKTVLVLKKSFGKFVEQAPIFFSFSLILFYFLTSQTHYEDAFSEDEQLKPLLL